MAEIQLIDVTKAFGKNIAVNRINLTAKDKEFLVLVGPSGCGKTTTLRMIAGLEDVTKGEILIGNREVNHIAPKDRDIAMVFQNYALYPHMSVYKNMSFGLMLRKLPKTEIDHRVIEAAKMLEIEDLLERKPKELSGGQRQRVAMGRAIVRKPQAFLFDEPLSNLDAKLRVQMRGELSRLHKQLNTTIIYVTHDQVEAMTLADRLVVMEKGIIMQVGNPMEVYNHPKNLFVAGFIGSPAMNLIEVRVVVENESLFVRGENFRLAVPDVLRDRFVKAKGREVLLGIRPEHLYDKQIKGPFLSGENLTVNIEVVEPIGSELILIVSLGSIQLTACVGPQSNAKSHMSMELLVDMNRIQLFDKKTEASY
jgi:multiple sugar transport system ATP-binding protein